MVAQLHGVTKQYGSVTALRALTLDIDAGGVTALLGPNGAGKTTAVKLLLGLTRPTSGTVRLFGADPANAEGRRRTGVMLQVANVPPTLRVREHVDLFRSYYPRPLTRQAALGAAGIESIADRMYGQLSGGQKQRVQFGLAICGDPELLFLDEPTVGLDVEARRNFWQHVRSLADRGRSIVLTTHYLEEADALANRVIVLRGGVVVADASPAALKAVAAARKIRCVSALAPSRLEALTGVRSVRRDGAASEILTADAEQTCRELLMADGTVSGLEISGAGLEEAFLALTTAAAGEVR